MCSHRYSPCCAGRRARPAAILNCCAHRREQQTRQSRSVDMLPLLIVGGILAGMPMTVPLLAIGVKGHDRASARRVPRPLPSPSCRGHCRSSPARQRRTDGSKEHPMITETQTRVIVLQLTDALLAQLQPFMDGLDIIATAPGAG